MVQTGANKPLIAGKERLAQLLPLSQLSQASLDELAAVLMVEKVSRGIDPTQMQSHQMEAMYLITGDLGIRYQNGKKLVLRGGTGVANNPINASRLGIRDTIALTPVEIVRIDLDVLDITQTWDRMLTLTNHMHGQLKKVLARVALMQNRW